MFLTDTLAKSSQNILAYSFVSDHSKHLLAAWRGGGGFDPTSPPLAPAPAKNESFFLNEP